MTDKPTHTPLPWIAERETLARMEPVAWMYERKGPWPARYFHDKRAPAYLDEGEGWTETPLYALPPAPGHPGRDRATERGGRP